MAFDMNDIKAHCFHDGIVTRMNRHWLAGDFPEDETETSGLVSFSLSYTVIDGTIICDSSDTETDPHSFPESEKLEDAAILELDIAADAVSDIYKIKINLIGGEKFYHIDFSAKNPHCTLYRYKGMSYKNILSPQPDEHDAKYLNDEKYFKGEEIITLPGNYSLICRHYSFENRSETGLISGHSYAKFMLKSGGETVHEYFDLDHRVRPFEEFIYHKNGHRYYPYKTHLYGISFFDIDTHEHYDYVPEGYMHDHRYNIGESFIITDIHYDSGSDLIAYGGCYWAGPSEVMAGDLSEPLGYDPHLVRMTSLIEFENEDDEYDDFDFVRWEENHLVISNNAKREFFIPGEKISEGIKKLGQADENY